MLAVAPALEIVRVYAQDGTEIFCQTGRMVPMEIPQIEMYAHEILGALAQNPGFAPVFMDAATKVITYFP